MAVTVMVSMRSLVSKLQKDFPAIRFVEGEVFMWSHVKQAVFYVPEASPESTSLLLHELAHALLDHHEYTQDIELLRREQEAWEYAKAELAPRYAQTISEATIQGCLDSYRDWLYSRSQCPACGENAPQTTNGTYLCHLCGCKWRANDAKMCELRRFILKPRAL